MQSSTSITCSTSTLIDHVLTSALSRVSQKCVINVGVSGHYHISAQEKFPESKQVVSISF